MLVTWKNYGILSPKPQDDVVDCTYDSNHGPIGLQGLSVLPGDQLPNRATGLLKINLAMVDFDLDNYLRSKGSVVALKTVERLLHTAHVLDHVLRRPHLIPDEWKLQKVYFSGTVYRSWAGNLYVRYLDYKSNHGQGLGSIKTPPWPSGGNSKTFSPYTPC